MASLPHIEKIYKSALTEHKEFSHFSESQLKKIITEGLGMIASFEKVGEDFENGMIEITPSCAQSIGVIWVLSGPGNIESPSQEEDNPRLKGKPWMQWMDRDRFCHATRLGREIGEKRGGDFPYIIYNGYPIQNEKLKIALEDGRADYPKEKVKIIAGDLKVTVDQVKTFELPSDSRLAKKEVVIVSHAPHLLRLIHILGKYKPFFERSVPFLSPLPTPEGGEDEFALMEIRGLLYYIFLKRDASEVVHPYRLLR